MVSPTTTPFPSGLLKSASPPQNISAPSYANGRRIIPVPIGPILVTAAGSGNIVAGFDLKSLCPEGGRVLGLRAMWTTQGTGTDAAATINGELDGVDITGGAIALAVASSAPGTLVEGSAVTGTNSFTSAGGILDVEITVGTQFTAGAIMLWLFVEQNVDRSILTGVFGEHVISRPGRLEAAVVHLLNSGSAGTTVIRARRNGTPIPNATATIAAASSAAATAIIPIGIDPAVGDVIDFEVTTAPTAGSGISAAPVQATLFTP